MTTSIACPFCSEPVHPDAAQCKHCGRLLAPLPPSASQVPASGLHRVTVTDIDMPFESMVTFMVKWAIAAIPAAIILFVVAAALTMALGALVAWPR